MRENVLLPFRQFPELAPGHSYRIVGAPGEGKTFFLTHVAEHCAQAGQDVLFVAAADRSAFIYDLMQQQPKVRESGLTVVMPSRVTQRSLDALLDLVNEYDVAVIDGLDLMLLQARPREHNVLFGPMGLLRQALESKVAHQGHTALLVGTTAPRAAVETHQPPETFAGLDGLSFPGSFSIYPVEIPKPTLAAVKAGVAVSVPAATTHGYRLFKELL